MTQNPITAIRIAKKLKRAQFARQSGIPLSTAQTIETGTVNTITYTSAVKIAQFAQRTPEEVQKEFIEWKRESLRQAA
jgi:transcriptional regulator with XRE-family HTH domain